jgi:predicted permease
LIGRRDPRRLAQEARPGRPRRFESRGRRLVRALYAGLIGLRGRTTEVTMFEAAMPPQIGGSIVAIQYGLDAKLISLMVGVGTVAAFLTLPAWSWAFGLF